MKPLSVTEAHSVRLRDVMEGDVLASIDSDLSSQTTFFPMDNMVML